MSNGEGPAPSAAEVGAEKTEKTNFQTWTDAVKESFGPLTDAGLKERDANFAAAVDGRKGEVEGFIQKLLGADADKGGGGETDGKSIFDLRALEKIVFDRTKGEQVDEGEKRLFNSLKVAVAALNGITRGEHYLYDAVYLDEKHKPDVADFVARMAAAGVTARETVVENFPDLKGMKADLGMMEDLQSGKTSSEAAPEITQKQALASAKILTTGRDVSSFTRNEAARFADKFLGTAGEKIKANIGNELRPNLVAGVDLEYGQVGTLDSIPVLRNLKKLQ